MKILKRITVVTAVTVMVLSLAGCGEKTGVINEEGNLLVPTLGHIETKTVQPVTQAPTQAPTQAQTDAANTLSFSNTTYALPEGFVDQGDISGTMVYSKPVNGVYASTIAYYVQNETLYTVEQMQAAYKGTIQNVYGVCSNISTKKINSRDYTVYSYKDYATPNGNVDVSAYVYSDGKTTIYVEFACVKGYTEGQSDIDAFMNSINVN